MDEHTVKRSRLKARLLTLLQAGAGSLVLATTVLAAPPAAAAALTPTDSLLKRADEARAELVRSLPAAEPLADKPAEVAWWGNRWGWGGRPWWPNWPNGWHNWPNWRNW
jgi:hypothetical protein